MTHAQSIYCTTNHRDFAINFKSWNDETREELNHIQQIQLSLNRIVEYENRQRNPLWTDLLKESYFEHLKKLVSTYESKYGKYEVNSIEWLQKHNFTETYEYIKPC
jgi:hypothetical protein